MIGGENIETDTEMNKKDRPFNWEDVTSVTYINNWIIGKIACVVKFKNGKHGYINSD